MSPRASTEWSPGNRRHPQVVGVLPQSGHPRGRHKARVFAAALGLTAADASRLRTKLLEVARTGEATPGEVDVFGRRYSIDFTMMTKVGKATIRSGWIVIRAKRAPRFTTCYVKRRRR